MVLILIFEKTDTFVYLYIDCERLLILSDYPFGSSLFRSYWNESAVMAWTCGLRRERGEAHCCRSFTLLQAGRVPTTCQFSCFHARDRRVSGSVNSNYAISHIFDNNRHSKSHCSLSGLPIRLCVTKFRLILFCTQNALHSCRVLNSKWLVRFSHFRKS